MDSPRTPRGLSSPEAKIGLRVEDLWYVQEPMLSPSEKLNSCFESIPVSSFPSAPPSLDERVVKMLDVGESSAMEVKSIASKALPLEEETTTTTENRSLMVDTITSSMTVRGADFVHADRLSTGLSTSKELLKINEELVEAREACRNLGGASDCKR